MSTPRIPVGNEIKVLQDKAIELFSWYTNREIQKTYAAPCMPIIQCSGTGKTKLLSDFKRMEMEKTNPEYTVLLISCLPKETRPEKTTPSVLDHYCDFRGKGADFLSSNLKSILGAQLIERSSIILLFDEAQELSRDGATHMHALQRFLRVKRGASCIAFTAGTNHSLASCYPTEDKKVVREQAKT